MNGWKIYKDGTHIETIFYHRGMSRDDIIRDMENSMGGSIQAYLERDVFEVKSKTDPHQAWVQLHIRTAKYPVNDHEKALRDMLRGWQRYRKAHLDSCSPIGNDPMLGPYWASVGFAIKRLLDGETGGFDCGTLAGNIVDLIDSEGIDNDGYEVE